MAGTAVVIFARDFLGGRFTGTLSGRGQLLLGLVFVLAVYLLPKGLAGLRTRELPCPVAVTALATVPPNLLGPLYLLAEPAGWFIPAGRFPGLIVVAVAGARLSRRSG